MVSTRRSAKAANAHALFASLPDEVLAHIILQIDTRRDAASASQVSRRWKSIINSVSSSLWDTIVRSELPLSTLRGSFAETLGLSSKLRYLLHAGPPPVPARSAEDLNNAFEFFIELGNRAFEIGYNSVSRDIALPLAITFNARADGTDQLNFRNDAAITIGFSPEVFALFARRRSDGALARVFQEMSLDIAEFEEGIVSRPICDGDSDFLPCTEEGELGFSGCMDMILGDAHMARMVDNEDDPDAIEWKEPFRAGQIYIGIGWSIFHNGHYSDDAGISMSDLWVALDEKKHLFIK